MTNAPLDNERFSRPGGATAAFLSALPYAAMGGGLLLAPLGALAGLFAAPWLRLHRAAASGGLPLAVGAAFFIWIAASSLWSPEPEWRDSLSLLGAALTLGLFVLAAGVARPADQAMVRRAAVAGLAVLMMVLAVEAQFDFPIARHLSSPDGDAVVSVSETPFGMQSKTRSADPAYFVHDAARASAVVVVCVWGVMAMLAPFSWPGWIGMTALLVGAAWLSLQFDAAGNAAALGLGLVAALCALRWPRAGVSVAAQIAAAWLVLAPFLTPRLAAWTAQALHVFANVDVPFSWLARIETWRFAAERIREKLVLGWGLGASEGFDQTYRLLGFTLPYIPRHPHNAPIQIWLETGMIGAALAATALATFGRRAGAALAKDRWAASAAAGTLITAAVIANISFGAWALWWWGALAAAAALVRASRKPA